MKNTASAATRQTVANRSGTSRKLLTRKALERAAHHSTAGDSLEDSFPAASHDVGSGAQATAIPGIEATHIDTDVAPAADHAPPFGYIEPAVRRAAMPLGDPEMAPAQVPSDPAAEVPQPVPAAAPAWSSEDERALQALMARRKAAGFQQRGRDVSGQMLRVGDISPNPNTVVATIVAIVAERGTVARGALVDAMAGAAFPHAKAKPADRAWCTGYIAGAVRDGFLSVGVDDVTDAVESVAAVAESVAP